MIYIWFKAFNTDKTYLIIMYFEMDPWKTGKREIKEYYSIKSTYMF